MKKEKSNKYDCGFGCKQFNSLCDACDSYMSDIEAFLTEKEMKKAWAKAYKGLSPWTILEKKNES